jgi:hypothetical protein
MSDCLGLVKQHLVHCGAQDRSGWSSRIFVSNKSPVMMLMLLAQKSHSEPLTNPSKNVSQENRIWP